MKKLWYLFLSLFLAFGLVACEKEGDIAPDPEPEPVGPTEAPKGMVSEVAFERDGYQTVELSWTDPEEEFPITAYQIVAKCEGQKNLTYSVEADDIVVVDGKQTYTVEGLEQPKYEVTILVANAFGQQKNGTVLKDVEPFTLESMVKPTITIVEKDEAKYLRFTNVNGARNIFDHLTFVMKDAEGNAVFEGEAAADEDKLAAALEDKSVANDAVDVLIELEEGVTLDETATYDVDYTIYAHPAIGGVIEEGAYVYEDVLDMLDEPASVEATAKDLGVGVEVQPLYFHFYSYGSKYLKELEQAVITVPQVYVAVSEGATQKEPLYHHYIIYTGTSENDYEVYKKHSEDGVYPATDEPWYEAEQVDAHAISELVPNDVSELNLYADVWAGQAINTIDLEHKEYPSYVRVEAYDKYGRMVAMGQRLCPTFSVRADQPDIQAHQPKWELLPNNDGLTFTLKASHLSAARGYARKVEWAIKDEAGEIVAEDMVEGGSSSNQNPTLITKEWKVEAKNFIVGKKYTVDYEIDYIPVYVIPGMDDQQPLDYDPETGKFTPTPSGEVGKATGMDHDVRILRDYIRDEKGNVKYRVEGTNEDGSRIYAFKHESGNYRGWVAWMDKSVVLTSEELVEAGATLENELTVPEENGEAAPYQINLAVSVPKKMNTVNLSWDAIAAEEITKVVISDGSEDIVVTEGGEYAWSVSDGRASFELEGVTGGPDVFVKAQVYAGEELLDEDEIGTSIFTLDNWQAPTFDWVLQQDGTYTFNVGNLMDVNYAFSHNIYEDVAGSEKMQSTIEIYDSSNQLVQTLYATSIPDWNTVDWAGYARWGMGMQSAWNEWVWEGQLHDSKGANQRYMPASALPAGNYTIKYKIGYVVNKEGFWSTSDYPYTRSETRPDPSVHSAACVAFLQTTPGLPDRITDFTNQQNEQVLYCENRLQAEAGHAGDTNVGKRKLVKVFVKTGEAQFNVSASTDPQIFPSATIDEGKEDITNTLLPQYVGKDANSKNGLYEAVKLTWSTTNCEPTKIVIAYGDKEVEVEGTATEKLIEGLKTSPVEFTVTAYEGDKAVASKKVTSDVYTLEPAKDQVTFTVKNSGDKSWILIDKGLCGEEWFFHDIAFNVYAKDDTNFENPIFSKNITKNGDGGLNKTIAAWASMVRGSYTKVDNSDYDTGCTPEYIKEKITIDGKGMEGYFTGLLPGTDYVFKYTLRAYPQIFSHIAENCYFFKSIIFDDAILENTIEGTFELTTPADLAPIATAEGYQAATVSWNAIADATGYEVYVGDKKVADAGAEATSVVVTGLTDASKYIFTVKALGTNATAQTAETKIFTLFGYNPNFTLVREQGDNGMVWRLRMFKLAGEFGIFEKIKFDIKDPQGNVVYSEEGVSGDVGFIGVHATWVGYKATNWSEQKDSKWATGPIGGQTDWRLKNADGSPIEFKYNTEYTIDYTATLTPGLCNDIQENNGKDGGIRWAYSAMASEKASVSGTMKYTTELDPTALIATAEAIQEWQAAQVSWNAITGATGYEVYVGDKLVVGDIAADATSVKVTGLTDATKYAFTVKAKGVDKSGTSNEVYVFTDAGWEAPVVKFTKADGGYQMTVSNMLHESFGYFSGKIVLKDGTGAEKYVFDHSFPAGTVWLWTCWRRVGKGAYERSDWKMNGSTAEAKVFDIAPGTYTVEYSINYTAFKDSVWGNGAGNYGKDPINPTTKDAAAYLIFNNFENDILWETRGAANGQGADGTGAMPYLFNKKGTFTGTYTIE